MQTHFGKGRLWCVKYVLLLVQSDNLNDVEIVETDGEGQTTQQAV